MQKETFKKRIAFVFILLGIIGALASFVLTYDKLQVMQDPNYQPGCNINPILSCGSVMATEQASLMGVPNTIFGLIAFSMLVTFGVLLLASTDIKKWVWQAAQLAAVGGVVFMHYLFFQGLYRINAICPWCFVVWMITIPIFWYVTQFNLREGNIPLPKSLQAASEFIQRHHIDILVVWYLIIFGLILERFWDYWITLI